MGLQEDYDALKRVHNSVNTRVLFLEGKCRDLEQLNAILNAEKKQWVQSSGLQAQVIHQQLESSDRKVRELQDEIIKLRTELKKYTDGDNN